MKRYFHLVTRGHHIARYSWALDAELGVELPQSICSCGTAI